MRSGLQFAIALSVAFAAPLCGFAMLDGNLQVVDLTDLDGDLPLNIVSTTQILWQTEDWEHPTWQNPSWPAGGGDTVGFPCVVKNDRGPNADGKYYLYYAHHDPRSGIGVAVADAITGPYSKNVNVPGRSDNQAVPAFHASSANPGDPDHSSSPWVVWSEEEQLWFLYFHYFNHIRNVVPGFQLTAMATTADLSLHDWTIWQSPSSGTTPQYVPVLPTTSDTWINEASSYNTVHRLPGGDWLACLRGKTTTAGDPPKIGFASSTDGRNWNYFPENPVLHQNNGGGGRAGVYRPGFIGYLGPNGSGVDEYLVAWKESHYFDGDARLIYGYTTDFKTITRDPRGHVQFSGADGAVGAWREGDRLYLFSGKFVHEMVLPVVPPPPDFDVNWGASAGVFFPAPATGFLPDVGDEALAQLYLAPDGFIDADLIAGGVAAGDDVVLDSHIVRNDGGAMETHAVFQATYQGAFQAGTLYAVLFATTNPAPGERYYRGPGIAADDALQLAGFFDMNPGPESANTWNGTIGSQADMRIDWRSGAGFIDDQGDPILPALGDETLVQLVYSPDAVPGAMAPGGFASGGDVVLDARVVRNSGGLWEDYGLFSWVSYRGPFLPGYVFGVAYADTNPQVGTRYYAAPIQATVVAGPSASQYEIGVDFVLGDAFNSTVSAPVMHVNWLASFGFVDDQGDPILPMSGDEALIRLMHTPDAVPDPMVAGGLPGDNDTVLHSATVRNNGAFRESYGFFGPIAVSEAVQPGSVYGVVFGSTNPMDEDRYYAGPQILAQTTEGSSPVVYEMNTSPSDGNAWNRTVAGADAMKLRWYGSWGFVDEQGQPILPNVGDRALAQLIHSPDGERDPMLPGGVPGDDDVVLDVAIVANNGNVNEEWAFFGPNVYEGLHLPGHVFGVIYENDNPQDGDRYYTAPLQTAPSGLNIVPYNLNTDFVNGNTWNATVIAPTAALDFDQDGMPNAFEKRHFGSPVAGVAAADVDLDQRSNIEEYIADTDPTDEESYFGVQSVAPAGNDIAVTLKDTSVNRGYALEFRDDAAGGGSWSQAGGMSAGGMSAGTGGDMQCVDPGAEGETGRAYRGAVSVP